MADLTDKDVHEIAQLAMLSLEPAHAEQLRVELSAILEAMAALAAVDTEGVPPMTHAMPMDLRLRDDVVAPSLPVEVALSAAATRADDCFVVPAILGGEA
ncbi:MAG: Asp-tRNA(Asn)/Glu-tRNA(Gln) amidotransferase subunit GatC [Kofleriaceae bacterium]